MNDTDRAQWIDNWEPLYNWWRAVRISKRKFIQLNRDEIDSIINAELHRPPQM